MATDDALMQMQVGTLAALVAICDALIAAKAIKASALIDRLSALATEEASPQLGTYGYTDPITGQVMIRFGPASQASPRQVLTLWLPRAGTRGQP